MAARHGTRTRYQHGCTDGEAGGPCNPCREAEATYQKARRHGVNTTVTTLKPKKDATTEDTTTAEPREPGPMEIACLAVCATVPRAETRPDLVQAALALARDIDHPLAIAQRSNLAARYQAILDDLLRGSEKKSKLAAVRQMTQATSATG